MLHCGALQPRDWLKSISAYMSNRTGAPTKNSAPARVCGPAVRFNAQLHRVVARVGRV